MVSMRLADFVLGKAERCLDVAEAQKFPMVCCGGYDEEELLNDQTDRSPVNRSKMVVKEVDEPHQARE